jgi:PAS domain S-box-containing protein
MSLFKKSLLFLLTILILQLAVFLGFGFQLKKAEHDAKLAAYSSHLVASGDKLAQTFHEMCYSLVIYAATRNSGFRNRYDQLREGLPNTVNALKNDKMASDNDKRDLERMSQHFRYIIDQLNTVENAVGNASLATFVRIHQMLVLEIQPHMGDLMESLKMFEDRHRYIESSIAADAKLTSQVRLALSAGLVVDVLATVAIVIVFSKGIVARLAIIADNFVRYAIDKPLHPLLPGRDEISKLDHKFHDLSRALAEAAEKDVAVFRSMPVGLITYNEDGIVESLNPKAKDLLGADTEEKVSLETFFADRGEYQRIRDVLTQQSSDLARAQLKRTGAPPFPAELSLSTFRHAGRINYLLAFTDITHREEIERLRQEFVSIVSHDVRTPLNSIMACLALLESGRFVTTNEVGRKYLKLAMKESDRLVTLTTDLLQLARIEAGTITLDSERCCVEFLMERAVEAVQIQGENKNITFSITSTDLEIFADRNKTIQILVNYLSNALKYSPANTEIKLFAEDCGEFVRINVQDQGRGIPKNYLGKVFERFKQVKAEDPKLGTGLGLAICKLLAESHGGSVGVSSNEGEGSTFWVSLPKALATDNENGVDLIAVE